MDRNGERAMKTKKEIEEKPFARGRKEQSKEISIEW